MEECPGEGVDCVDDQERRRGGCEGEGKGGGEEEEEGGVGEEEKEHEVCRTANRHTKSHVS